VSRGPVREALRRLEQEGLVRIVPGGGTFVATLTEADIADIYGVRAAIEGYAARAVVSDHSDLTSLDLALSKMRDGLVQPELSAMIEADVLFHRTLVGLAQSKRLLAIWEGLEGQVRLILSLTRDHVYRDRAGLADQHTSLVVALTTGDSRAAEAEIREHIEGRIGERQTYWRVHQGPRGSLERPAR
jgi:DNA-binding GntR family transcriptional regulator